MPARTLSSLGAESSRKRPRQSVSFHGNDEDDDDVVDVQSAQSSLRGDTTRKRPRVSDADSVKNGRRGHRPSTPSPASDQGSDESSSDDDEEGPTQRRARNAHESPDSPPKTQYELLRDANFDHLRHEAADDQRATQRLRFGRNLMGENHIADNGIIESITCVNFMCHERLHCELGPLLNFIVGENGSGKSAILTAITLCLGGKASSTNRGGSLKSFVKEGRERAVLTVKIKNRGQDAYKYDLYGDSIIVERHFSKTGSSGFKVKSALDRTISTKKQEVEEIVEYYALQVDNPLNVLSQDNARQFLNASTKAQKYKFFIEGVQLQQLDNDYRLISESLEQMIAKVPDQEERVKLAKENLNKAMQLKETIEGNRQIRVKYRTLRNQMVWAQVVDQERELAKRENVVLTAKEEVAKAEAEVVEKGQRLAVLDEKIERAKEALETLKEGSQELVDRERQLRNEHDTARKELANLHQEEREAHSSFKTARDNIATLSKSIADEEKRLEDANGEAHAAKTQELQDVRNEAKGIETEISNNKSRRIELDKQLDNEVKPALGRLTDECAQKRTEVEAAAAKVREIQKSTRGLYDGYEKQIPNLLKLIAEEKGFSEKPIGPFGAHIKLMKPQWSSIVETTLGGNLNGFLVTNVKDKTTLSGLMARLGIFKCPIFIGRPNTLDLSGKEPSEEFDTILRILKIDNLLVRDQLIINNSIEQLVLIRERREAQEVMFPASGGGGPRNVKAVYCFHDTIRGAGLRLTNRRGGDDISTEPVKAYTMPPRMQSDTDSQLAFQKDVLRQLEDESRHLENEKRRAQQDVQRLGSEVARLKKENATLESRLRKVRVKEGRIQEDLDKFDGADGRLQGLREQLAAAETTRDYHGSQYGTLKNLKIEKNKVAEETKAKADEAKLEKADHASRVGKAEDKLKALENTRRLILNEVNEANSAVEICKEAVEEAERKVARQAEYVATCIRQASAHSETRMHIPENETYKTIEKQYEVLGKRLAEEEKKTGMSDTQVNEYLIEAKKAHEKAVLDLESIKKVNAGLMHTLNQRLEKWRKFQRYISAQSRANFLYLLSERGFRGKLMLDHERKALDLQVEPDKTEKRAAGRSTKTLSGGEKSFSSICLLLAIWEAMGSPLRCLDEFDVFMDNVNRAISTNMLITAARRSVNRQYIFITPNAIEGRSTLDKDVKIIRLTDPRQRTLVDH